MDLLFQKFDEDANIDFESLDIAVNAVATAVKDFFFKVDLSSVVPQYDLSTILSSVRFELFFSASATLATSGTHGRFGTGN